MVGLWALGEVVEALVRRGSLGVVEVAVVVREANLEPQEDQEVEGDQGACQILVEVVVASVQRPVVGEEVAACQVAVGREGAYRGDPSVMAVVVAASCRDGVVVAGVPPVEAPCRTEAGASAVVAEEAPWRAAVVEAYLLVGTVALA